MVISTNVSAVAAGPAKFMMQTQVKGRVIEGLPIRWDDSQMLLFGRDGVLHEFHPSQAQKSKKTAAKFIPYSSADMRNRLAQEFGRDFEVTVTQHFVVAHPRGQWRAWADRLESLYSSFTRYMGIRGFNPSRPATPLVAVVFRNQADYYRHAAASGSPLMPGTLGHYSPQNNRVFLYDIAESGGNAQWAANAETIIHEATHQTAYNVGVHRRFAEQPRWLVEGLAMMFEAPGVWNGNSLQGQETRINGGRFDDFFITDNRRGSDWLMRLVATDQSFQSDPSAAYAEAWALNFYLCETRPREYTAYLAKVGRRKTFSKYPSTTRMTEFMQAFGSDLEVLDSQLRRFLEELQ